MKRSKTFKERVREHNDHVSRVLERAKQGEIICLTDLMISKERLVLEGIQNEKLERELSSSRGKQGGDEP